MVIVHLPTQGGGAELTTIGLNFFVFSFLANNFSTRVSRTTKTQYVPAQRIQVLRCEGLSPAATTRVTIWPQSWRCQADICSLWHNVSRISKFIPCTKLRVATLRKLQVVTQQWTGPDKTLFTGTEVTAEVKTCLETGQNVCCCCFAHNRQSSRSIQFKQKPYDSHWVLLRYASFCCSKMPILPKLQWFNFGTIKMGHPLYLLTRRFPLKFVLKEDQKR